jgi:RNA polymerase sigma factor (sigma-70 family)
MVFPKGKDVKPAGAGRVSVEKPKKDWGRILEDHRADLLKLARRQIGTRYLSKLEPESALQELAVKVLKGDAMEAVGSRQQAGYLRKVLRSVISDRLFRGGKKRKGIEIPFAEEQGSSRPAQRSASSRGNPERQASARRDRQAMLAAIDTLPADQRAVVEREYVGNRSRQEIARELGCSLTEVESLSRRAIRHLRKLARET